MWVLVVGKEATLHRPDGACAVLSRLGCRVESVDLWDPMDDDRLATDPPTVVLIEALEEVDAGRAALVRIRAVTALTEVPALLAVTTSALSRVKAEDAFDDFVLAPYVDPELYLRVRAVEWRRSEFASSERIKIGSIVLDLAAHEVDVDGRSVELTHQEFSLLKFLSTHRGRVFSREQLLGRVWGVDYYGGSRTVDIHIRRLRAKLGKKAAAPIQTVRGVGYKMKEP